MTRDRRLGCLVVAAVCVPFWLVVAQLACRALGHPRFESALLGENATRRYAGGFRDDLGRARGWPVCVRCGLQVVVVDL